MMLGGRGGGMKNFTSMAKLLYLKKSFTVG